MGDSENTEIFLPTPGAAMAQTVPIKLLALVLGESQQPGMD
jgi:hypothetical protein